MDKATGKGEKRTISLDFKGPINHDALSNNEEERISTGTIQEIRFLPALPVPHKPKPALPNSTTDKPIM
jgi:hypothetical protein